MKINTSIHNADYIGATASILCLIHCLATPLIFVAKASAVAKCADAPLWWRSIDFIFIVVSFIAIYFAAKHSTKNWLKISFWLSWSVLLIAILNDTFHIVPLSAIFIYVPALLIVVLHFYNLKYCKCAHAKTV